MKKIMLLCGAGMSTSLLVTKMQKTAKEMGDEVEIFALGIQAGMVKLAEVDCILLGPQMRYQQVEIKKQLAKLNLNTPFEVIDMRDYGTMNGEKVYKHAKEMMNV